jgi:hypothetical protein
MGSSESVSTMDTSDVSVIEAVLVYEVLGFTVWSELRKGTCCVKQRAMEMLL